MRAHALIVVLGHQRILLDAAPAAARASIGRDAATDGVVAFQPLYGRGAEGVVAVRDPQRFDVICGLIERIDEALHADGRANVAFALSLDQVVLAERVAAWRAGARLSGSALVLETRGPVAPVDRYIRNTP
jgi:hypothetical protein